MANVKAVFPGNSFEFWMDVSTNANTVPDDGRGGTDATPSNAIWDAVLGLTAGTFTVKILRVYFDAGAATADTLIITPTSGGGGAYIVDQPGFVAPGPLGSPIEVNAPMLDGFLARLSNATATAKIHFEIWLWNVPATLETPSS